MADPRPTWQLVVEVARGLSARHNSFRLADIVEGVQRLDASRARTSIQPVVQGMASNAGRGPQQPCGKVLVRTDHGWYRLLPAGLVDAPVERAVARRPVPRPSSAEPRTAIDVHGRVREVIERFDELVAEYDRTVPFQRSGQYERPDELADAVHVDVIAGDGALPLVVLHSRVVDKVLRHDVSVESRLKERLVVGLPGSGPAPGHETRGGWGSGGVHVAVAGPVVCRPPPDEALVAGRAAG